MVTTPTIWKARYQLNHTDSGSQSDPDVIDIGRGRYVAVWTEDVGGPIGTDDGSDLVGQIFDAKGRRVGNEFQVNQGYHADDEHNAALASRPGGGFVMVFEDTDALATSIRVETYDVNGNLIPAGDSIAQNFGPDVLSNPAIAMRPNGSYLVAYNRDRESTDGFVDIVGRTVNASGTVSAKFNIFDTNDAARGTTSSMAAAAATSSPGAAKTCFSATTAPTSSFSTQPSATARTYGTSAVASGARHEAAIPSGTRPYRSYR